MRLYLTGFMGAGKTTVGRCLAGRFDCPLVDLDAAVDLGVIRARVCDPSSLLLSNRHAGVRAAAEQEHRRKWSAEENPPEE